MEHIETYVDGNARLEVSFPYYLTAEELSDNAMKNSKAEEIRESFENFVLQVGYPCIGAQAAVNGKSYAIGLFNGMDNPRTAKSLGLGLTDYIDDVKSKASNFMTYIAIFINEDPQDEVHFEKSLWELLNRLHVIDIDVNNWSKNVGHDPTKSDFSFSFGRKAFFMVGLHPNSSRKARRFKYTAIAFNLHEQFENLRAKGRFATIRDVVRERDMTFSGSINPMLEDYGEGLEAPQYSGRKVSSNWECPFSYKGK